MSSLIEALHFLEISSSLVMSKTSSGGTLGKRFVTSNDKNIALFGTFNSLMLLTSSKEFFMLYLGRKFYKINTYNYFD